MRAARCAAGLFIGIATGARLVILPDVVGWRNTWQFKGLALLWLIC